MVSLTDLIIDVRSSAFENGQEIPEKYTCDGENVNPPLAFDNFPENTVSLALIVDDPDAPGQTFNHWVVWNISPKLSVIKENSVPGTVGENSYGEFSYSGPCPPAGKHRYFFQVFALDINLNLPIQSNVQDLLIEMEGHVLAQGRLVGAYSRK